MNRFEAYDCLNQFSHAILLELKLDSHHEPSFVGTLDPCKDVRNEGHFISEGF
jgi:hypothetical protein